MCELHGKEGGGVAGAGQLVPAHLVPLEPLWKRGKEQKGGRRQSHLKTQCLSMNNSGRVVNTFLPGRHQD